MNGEEDVSRSNGLRIEYWKKWKGKEVGRGVDTNDLLLDEAV